MEHGGEAPTSGGRPASLSDAERARIILEQGPYSAEELAEMPLPMRSLVVHEMVRELELQGPEQFLKNKHLIRQSHRVLLDPEVL